MWAAGDCCESFHLVSERPVHVALGTVANKQGRVAGINLGGGYATFPGVVGTAVSKLCALEVARSGLNQREAAEAGFEVHREGRPPEEVRVSGEDQIVHMLEDFGRAALQGEPVRPPPEEAVRTLRVLDALAESARAGREVSM